MTVPIARNIFILLSTNEPFDVCPGIVDLPSDLNGEGDLSFLKYSLAGAMIIFL